ncbi:cytochrome b5 [Clavulina sp. PMI_390]|nr:cytochrome b5 [Clavulina sp. PMI_390]
MMLRRYSEHIVSTRDGPFPEIKYRETTPEVKRLELAAHSVSDPNIILTAPASKSSPPTPNMDSPVTTFTTLPINIALLTPIAYLIWDILFPRVGLAPGAPIPSSYEESYLWRPKTHMPAIVWAKYSPQTLEPFDGKRNPRILLAINRIVYDVSAGKSFYGPEGPYGNFAGRDASRGMAKQSFDLDMLTPVDARIDPLKDITKSEIDNMNGWSSHFENKYVVCGELVENDEL